MSPAQARTWFYTYSAVNGISLAFIFAVFKMGSIFTLFFGTSAMFGAVSLYGYTTKRDLTQFGSFLFMGLMGLIVTGLINLFVQSTVIATATSLIAVLLFAGLTAYDVQMLKDMYDRSYEGEREMLGIYGALQLYMNFINMFINLLMLFGDRK
jgi:FtsH-binding integral membrane protein